MRRRRHSKGWAFLMFLILLGLIAFILFRHVFVVRNVEFTGSLSVSEETITRAARVDFGGSIFSVDEDAMRRGVNALGTIKLDAVEVRYPNTLILRISERRRDAMLLHLGEIRLLDEEGCLVESVSAVPNTDLIYVNGMTVTNLSVGEPVQAKEGQAEAYRAIMQAINANAANSYVSEIDVTDVSDLRLITRTGIRVELGDASNMQNKIAWMRSTVADLEQRREAGGTLDVRSGTKADYSSPDVQRGDGAEQTIEPLESYLNG